ncbi:MAG TPA: amidase [Acidimicrobiales bacterium]|jgi:amidase
MDELGYRTATDLAAAIRSKQVGSRELLEHYLDRVERLNPAVNAVVTLDAERARQAAGAADDAVARGSRLGPLHGLPITVKDALETAGIRSTGGATELGDHVPEADADAVARVKAAGAIVFGKTNVPRWSGDVQTWNELFGATRNPWDLSRSPGGSSGGPAVSVACGLTAFEIGTDIGGSIRMPAHFTGICGHKPSFGLVPSRGYLDHVGGGLTEADINVIGPLGRSVGDLELVLDVLAGPDRHRAPAWRLALPPARVGSPAGLRVGAWLDDPACPVDREVVGLLEAAVHRLETAGATIDADRRPVALDEAIRLFLPLVATAVSPGLPDDVFELARAVEGIPPAPGEDRALVMGRGTVLRHRDWILLDEARERMRGQWAAWFEDHDVLLCPVTPAAAQPLSDVGILERTMTVNGVERPATDHIHWPGVIGVAYLPSTVVPVGRTAAGLPVGVQVVGPYLGDRTTLAVAAWLEGEYGYVPPPTTPS